MRKIDKDEFNEIIKRTTTIKPRFKRDVRFTVSTQAMHDEDWAARELVAIHDKNKNSGIVLLQPYDVLYVLAFETGGAVRDSSSGRSKAIICDFCYTWRTGGDAGLITFFPDSQTKNSTAQLCCLDLQCSEHVRTKTKAALMSRAQLREHLTPEARVLRLKEHLQVFIDKLQLEPVEQL